MMMISTPQIGHMVEGTQGAARTRLLGKQKRGRHAATKPDAAKGGLMRSSMLMAAGTVVSRATGLLRTVLQAGALGTGLLATTYNQANVVPASLYFLLIGGALNSVLVPQLVRARMEQPDGGGDVRGGARLDIGDPQRGAVRGGQELDVAAEALVFLAEPQVVAVVPSAGQAVALDEHAVEGVSRRSAPTCPTRPESSGSHGLAKIISQ